MHKRTLLLTSVLIALYGCQPEAPKQAAQPAATTPVAQPPAEQTAKPAAAATPTEPAAQAANTAVKPEAPKDDVMLLAKKSGCLACHAIDKKGIGPKWKDVATKYRGDTGAEPRLMEKIAKGGKGVWGSMPMPAHPKVSEADIKTLVQFVLSLE